MRARDIVAASIGSRQGRSEAQSFNIWSHASDVNVYKIYVDGVRYGTAYDGQKRTEQLWKML